ncbi:hypothetical protein V8C42DRAFT_183135 [Trichoderma barbatum]
MPAAWSSITAGRKLSSLLIWGPDSSLPSASSAKLPFNGRPTKGKRRAFSAGEGRAQRVLVYLTQSDCFVFARLLVCYGVFLVRHHVQAKKLRPYVLYNTRRAFTHSGLVSRPEACRNWVAIAGTWCGLSGSFLPPQTQCDDPAAPLSTSLERTANSPLWTIFPLPTTVPELLQTCPEGHSCSSKVPPLAEQCDYGASLPDSHHQLSKQNALASCSPLRHSASTWLILIRSLQV